MNSSNFTKRKNFRCVFNRYVTRENQDAIVRSIISQFEGYYAEPEVTITDDGFIISLVVGDNLSTTVVRDKILWNQFIDSVTAQDAIRKIQILRLPKAGIMDFGERIEGQGSVGGFGPEVDPIVGDTHVDEKLNTPLTEKPRKYQIDADPGDSLGHHASVKYADPTDTMSEDQTFVPGLTPEGLSSDATDVDSDPTTELDSGKRQHARVFNASFKVIAIDSDTGGSFTMTKPNGFQDVGEPPASTGRKNFEEAKPGTGLVSGDEDISAASFYVTQPGNEQGTEMGIERNRDDNKGFFNFSSVQLQDEPEAEDVKSVVDLPQARGGDQSVPDGGQVEGWFGSKKIISNAAEYFGITETYDYQGDIDDYEL